MFDVSIKKKKYGAEWNWLVRGQCVMWSWKDIILYTAERLEGGTRCVWVAAGNVWIETRKTFIYFLFLLNRFVTERIQVLTAPVRLFFFFYDCGQTFLYTHLVLPTLNPPLLRDCVWGNATRDLNVTHAVFNTGRCSRVPAVEHNGRVCFASRSSIFVVLVSIWKVWFFFSFFPPVLF